jgi:hypothetical protein
MIWSLFILVGIFVSKILSNLWYSYFDQVKKYIHTKNFKIFLSDFLKIQNELSFLSKEVKKFNSIDLFTTKAKIERQIIKREKYLEETKCFLSYKISIMIKYSFYLILKVQILFF